MEELCLQIIADKGLSAIPHANEPNWSNLTDNDAHDCRLFSLSSSNFWLDDLLLSTQDA